jgi:hypothetical protein
MRVTAVHLAAGTIEISHTTPLNGASLSRMVCTALTTFRLWVAPAGDVVGAAVYADQWEIAGDTVVALPYNVSGEPALFDLPSGWSFYCSSTAAGGATVVFHMKG